MQLAEWIEGYRRAWEERDPAAAAALFTEDASYRSSPFREPPNLGHEGVLSYWTGATSTQEDVHVEMGEPLVDGNHVAVEWWTSMRSDGEEITLVGCLLLRFAPDGLVPASIGKAVHDRERYRALSGADVDWDGFFPAYRAPR